MARIIFIGGGVVGLGAAHLLGKDGHDVTALERDPAPPPDPEVAWNGWERRGVNQFRMLHYFQARYREVMHENAPEIEQALTDAGALRFNPIELIPAEITGGFEPADECYAALTARRPIAEAAIASVVAANDHVSVRRGVAVTGLVTGDAANGVPHVVGVRTDSGEELRADVVIDAGGRRSVLPKWLGEIGARTPVEEIADCGFVYYGRHFKSADGSVPAMFGPLLAEYGTFSVLTLPADNGTWGIGIVASADDKAMRRCKDVDVWTSVAKSLPLSAHWLDGEPIDDGVAIMAKIEDRHRDFVIDGVPVATGVLALADSWACTNPSVGRGISIGTIHAVALRDLLRDAPSDPAELAAAWHAATMATVEPWYRGTLDFDEGRLGEINALLEGREYEPDPTFEITKALQAASMKDPDVLRAFFRLVNVLELPEEILAVPGRVERVIELGAGWRDEALPGPTREELLAIVAA